MPGLGLGLGLGFQNNSPASRPFEETIKAAIKERKHITAVVDGVRSLFQPYALLKAEGALVLRVVEVAVEGGEAGSWAPRSVDVARMSDVKIYDHTFVPSDAFDATILDGVVAAVEHVDPFQDASQRGTK